MSDYVPRTAAPIAPKKDTTPAKPGGELGKDAFLKLLVAQLKYQDPSAPTDNTQFLAETAQFTTVEKLTDLATTQQSLLTAQLQVGASNLIGRTVTYLNDDDKLVTGTVSAANFTGSTVSLRVADKDVALASVTEVRATPTAPAAAAPTTGVPTTGTPTTAAPTVPTAAATRPTG